MDHPTDAQARSRAATFVEIKAQFDSLHPRELWHEKWPNLAGHLDFLLGEVDRLTHLHALDHSLADQWQAENEVLRSALQRIFERLCQDGYSQQDDPLLLISEVLSGG